jgi:hypothetical protein
MLENWARSEALALYWNNETGLCLDVAKSCFALIHLSRASGTMCPWFKGSMFKGLEL